MKADEPAGKFKGALLWWDPLAKNPRGYWPEKGPVAVVRAIVSDERLAIEFELDGQQYSAVLRRSGARFSGKWEAGRGGSSGSGAATCTLHCLEPEGDEPRAPLLLGGKWLEDLDWTWNGKLVPVASFEPSQGL
jgi:hypothetical protein